MKPVYRLTLERIRILKEAHKETSKLTSLVTNLMLLNQETPIFKKLKSGLSGLENDLKANSDKFKTLSLEEFREEGNCLIWKICKIRTLIQEEARKVSDNTTKSDYKKLFEGLIKIETGYIHPIIVNTIDPSY